MESITSKCNRDLGSTRSLVPPSTSLAFCHNDQSLSAVPSDASVRLWARMRNVVIAFLQLGSRNEWLPSQREGSPGGVRIERMWAARIVFLSDDRFSGCEFENAVRGYRINRQ